MHALIVALLAVPLAHADEALRARCLDLLSAYEDPATAADWRALGDAAGAELLAIAQDPTLSPTRRGNAVVALGFFPAEAHRSFLSKLATTEGGEPLLRRKAVHALAVGYGDRAVPDLATALAAPDIHLRAAAAKALGKVGTASAKEALKARLAVETDRMVRDALTTTLAGK